MPAVHRFGSKQLAPVKRSFYTPRKETANEMQHTEGGSACQHWLCMELLQQSICALRTRMCATHLSSTLYMSSSPHRVAVDMLAKLLSIPGGS